MDNLRFEQQPETKIEIKQESHEQNIKIEAGLVYTSEQGPRGERGEKGEKGEKGDKGADGASAFEVAIRNGFKGTVQQWLSSLKGQKGDTPNIEVGAVNLLRNTAKLTLGDRERQKWAITSGGNGTIQILDITNSPNILANKMLRVSGNTNGGNKDLSQTVNLEVGKKYTVSCYARLASNSNLPNVRMLIRSWANNTDAPHRLYANVNHAEWRRYSFTFTALVASNSIQLGQNGDGIIEICCPQIEQGTIATDYAPSPDDTTAGSNRIQLVNTNYQYAQALIDTYSRMGYMGDWTVANDTNPMSIGDVVILKMTNTTKASNSFVLGEIVNINTANSLKIRSFGLLEKGDKGQDGAGGSGSSYNDTELRNKITDLETGKADKSAIPTLAELNKKVDKSFLAAELAKKQNLGDYATRGELVSRLKEVEANPNKLEMGSSTQAVEENGFGIYRSEVGGQKYINFLIGRTTRKALKGALGLVQPPDWDSFEVGWGLRIFVKKINGMVFWQLSSTAHSGNGTMQEVIPEEFRPAKDVNLIFTAVNNGNFNGGGYYAFRSNGAIERQGTSGHNEYVGSGVYLAQSE